MKKILLSIFVALLATLLSWSCTQDYTEIISVVDDAKLQPKKEYRAITEDEAYGAVERFLEQIDPQTRGFRRTVQRGKMFTLRRSHVNRAISRGSQEDTPLLGFVNLGNNSGSFTRNDPSNGGNGYAVVNMLPQFADTLLIITDIGDIQKEDIMIDDYAGLPDSLLSQYASLYSPELEDYYIGNAAGASITNVTVDFAWDYVRLRSDYIGDDNDTIVDGSGESGSGGENSGSEGGSSGDDDSSGGGGSLDQPANDTLEYRAPMLKTHWHQEEPYNSRFHLAFQDGVWKPRLAGCVTIAAAQILAYLKNVSLSEHFGVTTSSWSSLEKDFTMNDVYTERDKLARVIKQMADGIEVQYNYLGSGGTFATPRMLKRYLASIGCGTNKHLGYGQSVENRIIRSLNNNYPVFIGALDGFYGHAWVIDGYFKLSQLPESNMPKPNTNYFMHCNMGWAGEGDGWYLSGLFTNCELYEDFWDYTGDSTDAFFYTWCFRTLFFD